MSTPARALVGWGGGEVVRPLAGGNTSAVWLVMLAQGPAVARATRQGEPHFRWLMRALQVARRAGLTVPDMIRSQTGTLVFGGWVLETFIDGDPGTAGDLAAIAPAIARIHRLGQGFAARPGLPALGSSPRFVHRSTSQVLRSLAPGPRTLVHGDLHGGNLLRMADGLIALIDWAEARCDHPIFDFTGPKTAVARRLHQAAEVEMCWRSEPAYARALARRFMLAARPVRPR